MKLTKRETEIIKMVAVGMTAMEISGELKISFGAVQSHKGNLYSKLGVCNAVEATHYAIGKGLVEIKEF